MARFVFAIVLLATTVLQALILPDLLTVRVLPNFVLVLILCWSALRGVGEGAIWALSIGIVFDAIALDPLGANSLALIPVCILGMWAGRRFFQSSVFLPIPITFIATWIYALTLLIIRASDGNAAPVTAIGPLLFLQALLNSMAVVLVYPVTRSLSRSVTTRR